MRRGIRLLGTVLATAGVLTLLWSLLVWQWQDPFTALYTKWKQHQLASQYVKRTQSFKPSITADTLAAERASIAREAKRYRLSSTRGEVIGRLRVPRMGVNMLVYIAGHRTTYLAPFSHIDRLRRGDRVTIEVPYGTFIYAVTRHRIVKSTDLSVLRSPRHELVELKACHPRFFASHRYIAYAQLLRVEPRGAKP